MGSNGNLFCHTTRQNSYPMLKIQFENSLYGGTTNVAWESHGLRGSMQRRFDEKLSLVVVLAIEIYTCDKISLSPTHIHMYR